MLVWLPSVSEAGGPPRGFLLNPTLPSLRTAVFISSQPVDVKWLKVCMFPIDDWILYLWAICCSSSVVCPFMSFVHFSLDSQEFFTCSECKSLCRFRVLLLSSPFMGYFKDWVLFMVVCLDFLVLSLTRLQQVRNFPSLEVLEHTTPDISS